MTETKCSNCGVAFDVKPYRLARNKGGLIYCSRDCRQAHGRTFQGPPRAMGDLTCPVCGATFYRKPAERRAVNWCSYQCAGRAAVNEGRLKPAPKGVRRARGTEFKPGVEPHNRVPVGTVRIRRRPNRNNDTRAWVKVAEPNVWRPRAVLVWEEAHGPLDDGMVVHHHNRDTLDDSIGNLEALDRATHLHEHRQDFRG